jgi:quercetin dioxygenase-like cupin family protein
MKKICYIDIPDKENGHGVSVRKLHENNHVQVVHIKLNPGEKIDPHTTPVDVFFYVLEGVVTVAVGNERNLASKDTLIDSPANIPHALYNESARSARILCVKSPHPGQKI